RIVNQPQSRRHSLMIETPNEATQMPDAHLGSPQPGAPMLADPTNDSPLVSIGLPVYNGERFLGTCLDSLLAQTYANLEIVISDNASTDGTPALCEEYAARDPRIRFVRSDRNRGAAWNHNQVASMARGVYFRWCGADDALDPRFIEACVATLESQRDAVLAFPLSIVIDETGA